MDIFYKISGLTSLNDFNFYQKAKNEPSDTYLRFTNEFEFNNPDLFNIAHYRRCFEWLPSKYIKSNGLDYYKNIEEAYDFVISLSQHELCKKYIEVILLNNFIEDSKETLNYSLNSLIEKRFTILEQNKGGIKTYLSILQNKYIELLESEKKSKEYISLLENEKYSEGIKLRDFSSNKNADFLKTIIQQYPGKVLYIDIWAPWCGPCMQEMFFSNELQKKYENADIEFIFLIEKQPITFCKLHCEVQALCFLSFLGCHVLSDTDALQYPKRQLASERYGQSDGATCSLLCIQEP